MNKIFISNAELSMLIEAIDYAAQQVHDSEIPIFNGFDFNDSDQIQGAFDTATTLKQDLMNIAGDDAIIIIED